MRAVPWAMSVSFHRVSGKLLSRRERQTARPACTSLESITEDPRLKPSSTSERRWSNVSLSHAACGRFEHDRPRGGQARLSCPRQARQWKGCPERGGPLSLRGCRSEIATNAARCQLAVSKGRYPLRGDTMAFWGKAWRPSRNRITRLFLIFSNHILSSFGRQCPQSGPEIFFLQKQSNRFPWGSLYLLHSPRRSGSE